MSHRTQLLKALNDYSSNYDSEKSFIKEVIDFVKDNEDCFERSNQKGHVNGSAWLISPDSKKTLLTHHKKLNRWLQLGGHSDGDNNILNVALKEAEEESGIADINPVKTEIFDIDVHDIPENKKKGEPKHKHYDIRFLLQAENEDFIISDESNDLKWVTLQELDEMAKNGEIDEAITRMQQKWKEFLK